MATKTYKGSCHCGKVKFEADIDLAAGTGKCNCTYCTKIRNWSVLIPEEYGKHGFCKHCGISTFSRGHLKEVGGDYVSIMLGSLDDASIDELVSGPQRYSDGRNNNWMNPPADVRNL